MNPLLPKYLHVFNGMLDDEETGFVEAVKIPIRDPDAPAVVDSEFLRLAKDGHVPGVRAFLADEANVGRVDELQDEEVSGGGVDLRRGRVGLCVFHLASTHTCRECQH